MKLLDDNGGHGGSIIKEVILRVRTCCMDENVVVCNALTTSGPYLYWQWVASLRILRYYQFALYNPYSFDYRSPPQGVVVLFPFEFRNGRRCTIVILLSSWFPRKQWCELFVYHVVLLAVVVVVVTTRTSPATCTRTRRRHHRI